MLHLSRAERSPRLSLRPVPGVDLVLDHGPIFPAEEWTFSPLAHRAYDVIVADPPWRFMAWSKKGVNQKSPGAHYETMRIEDIAALPVAELAAPAGALLLMWATSPMLPAQLEVMKSWGFVYNSQIIWRKIYQSGQIRMGTGYRIRGCHEIVIIGKRGKVPRAKTVRSIFDGVGRNRRPGEESQHSRKPTEFWPHVEPIFPGAKRWCELFSRQSTTLESGIRVEPWGNEVGKFDHG